MDFDGRDERSYRPAGRPEQMAAEIRRFADLGVSHLALWFATTDPAQLVAQADRFGREVALLSEPERNARGPARARVTHGHS